MALVWFIDCEASSLSKYSYPIEVGIAAVDTEVMEIVQSDGLLITPDITWSDWCPDSQSVHGISRTDLFTYGKSIEEVTAWLNDLLEGQKVFSDSHRDSLWTSQLFAAANSKPKFTLGQNDDLIRTLGFMSDLSDAKLADYIVQAQQMLNEPNPHRAEADARFLANVYCRAHALVLSLHNEVSDSSRDKP